MNNQNNSIMETVEREETARDARRDALGKTYAADVRQLYEVWAAGTGVSKIAGDLLRVLHCKSGAIEPVSLFWLDTNTQPAALRLIETCAMASMIPDAGLTIGIDGEILLSSDEVVALIGPSDDLSVQV
ncbi:hypothetical protein RNZ50_00590 [Paracoccaceae bacterium Fryx2]|nr:hypothetical protein [Paracoccaceae bacterium Fryx2]